MKNEDQFDFNTYSKFSISAEEAIAMSKEMEKHLETAEKGLRERFYSLPSDEEKILWLRKLLVNTAALNKLLYSFLPELMHVFPFSEEKPLSREEYQKLIFIPILHIHQHLGQFISDVYCLKFFKDKEYREKEEIQKLKEMMK